MLKFRSIIKSVLASRGFDVIPTHARHTIPLLDGLARLFDAPGIDLVIDVGGNRGQFRDTLRYDTKYPGRIISFEPSPDDFAVLSKRAAEDPNWEVHQIALGSENATLPFHVMRDSVMSSLHTIDPDGETQFRNCEVERVIEVDVRRLDDLVKELGISGDHILIKVDTQGHDMEVLLGAPATIAKSIALLAELSQLPIYEGSPDFLTSVSLIRDWGFAVAALSPVNVHQNAVVEFDCLMVRPTVQL